MTGGKFKREGASASFAGRRAPARPGARPVGLSQRPAEALFDQGGQRLAASRSLAAGLLRQSIVESDGSSHRS